MTRPHSRAGRPQAQRGIATLLVALVILGILTIIVLYSTHVAFFEQKTASNENRSRLVEQAAEYSINLAGEYLKANRDYIISNRAGTATTGGWLSASVGTGRKWVRCSTVTGFPDIPNLSDGTPHPCMAERDATPSAEYPTTAGLGGRRGQMYFFSSDGSTLAASTTVLPFQELLPDSARLDNAAVGVGGAAKFPATTVVRALLCRIDSSLPNPACRAEPTKGNRIAVTMVANVTLADENSSATIKETWATLGAIDSNSAVPLIATGLLSTGGTITIVPNPNAGGYGLPGSFWTPNDAQVENSTGGGAANIASCYIQDFMKGEATPTLDRAKVMCPTNGSSPPCHCPSAKSEDEFWLSGSASGSKRENIDVLDRDNAAGAPGSPQPPDITFFPGAGPSDVTNPLSTPIALDRAVGSPPNTLASNASAASDDSLFEFIFGVNYVVADRDITGTTLTNCGSGSPPTQNCADFALRNDLGAEVIEGDCAPNQFGPTSYGLYYVTGNCTIDGVVAGSKDAPVIIVVFGEAVLKGATLYGMLFVHSNDIQIQNASSGYRLDMQGATIFGSLIVEGDISMTGNSVIVYDNTSLNADPYKLPSKARFARVPGSWLDRQQGF
jgi:type II secretory pathway pseudopilin PulG